MLIAPRRLIASRLPVKLSRRFSTANPPSLHVARNLSDITKLPVLRRESPSKVREIWLTHETKPRVLNSVMTDVEYSIITSNAARYGMFIVPVRADEGSGFFNMVMQWKAAPERAKLEGAYSNVFGAPNSRDQPIDLAQLAKAKKNWEVVFCSLEEYRSLPPSAVVPWMVLNVFSDLIQSHNLALMRCDMINPKLSRNQAARTIKFVRELYRDEGTLFQSVRDFTVRPAEFDFQTFIDSVQGRF